MRQEEGLKIGLDTKNNRALLLNSACSDHLSVRSIAILPYWKYPKVSPNGRSISTIALLSFTLEKQFETLQ